MTPNIKQLTPLLQAIEKSTTFTLKTLQSHNRATELVWCRAWLSYQLRKQGWTNVQIGKVLNRRYCTISNLFKIAERWAEEPQKFPDEITFCRNINRGREQAVTNIAHQLRMKRISVNPGRGVEKAPTIGDMRTCKGCDWYPCFRGIDTMKSNLALTCRSFNEKPTKKQA